MTPTLHAIDLGYGMYRLHVGDLEVGWVAGIGIGFRGFWTVEEAARRAATAHHALTRWLARQRRTAAAPRADALRVRREEARAELTIGDVVVGWVVPMGASRSGQPTEFAFELRLPAGIDPALTLSAARTVHAALERRGAARALAPLHAGGRGGRHVITGESRG